MSNFTIGILGGMGPRATVYFEQKLIDAFTGPDQSLPRIVVVNDGSIPDRTAFLCEGGSDPLPALVQSSDLIMQAKPDIVCLPCNTAHATRVLGRLQAEIQLPVVDMPAAALEQAKTMGAKRVLVLGTDGTRLSRVYDERASECVCIYPDGTLQATVTSVIYEIKQSGVNKANARKLSQIIGAADCDVAILACTELSMLMPHLRPNRPIIDALEALVASCRDHAIVHEVTAKGE